MPYTNGIFHIDYVNGNDAARAALTGCVASNPSGTITRINKTAHGLVTGAVVDLTLFTAWLNNAWKITVVDADNFDLDTAVWQATADNNGTVTPRGGSSWTDAWLTINTGATAARIQAGDEIRLAKTSESDSGVDGTFTNNNRTVTLSTALTKTIQHANVSANWTASANITIGTNTARKIGATAVTITPAAAFTTGKACYALVAGGGTQDFSAYSKITFWIRTVSGAAVVANTWRISLCSDATGDTPVNVFNIPALLGISNYHAITLDYGGALASNVQSISISALVDPGTTALIINNISACNDVSLQSIIGPENDVKYCPQAFDDTTVTIDTSNNSAAGQGWSGTTGTYNLFYSNPIIHNTLTAFATVNESGNSNRITTYSGGWNTGTNIREGYTFVSNIANGSSGISINGLTKIQNIGLFRFANSIGLANECFLDNIILSNASSVINTTDNFKLNNSFILNNSVTPLATTATSGTFEINNCKLFNNSGFGSLINAPSVYNNCEFRNNSSGSLSAVAGYGGPNIKSARLYKCILSDTTEVSVNTASSSGIIWSYDHDNTVDNRWGFANNATINWQTAVKQGSDPGAWRVVHSGQNRGQFSPVTFTIAELACEANVTVTVNVWVKRDLVTVNCRIYVLGEEFTLPGIVAAEAVAANNTSWQQLQISFTPTRSGIVPILFDSWWVSGANSNTYVGSISIT